MQPGAPEYAPDAAPPGAPARPSDDETPPHELAIAGPRRPAQRAERSTHGEPGGVTGGAAATTADVRQLPVAAPPLRSGTPNPDDPPDHYPVRHDPGDPEIRQNDEIRQRRLRAAIRVRRERTRDPEAEPSMTRMFGQFGLLGLSVLAIMAVILLGCVIGFEIVTRG